MKLIRVILGGIAFGVVVIIVGGSVGKTLGLDVAGVFVVAVVVAVACREED